MPATVHLPRHIVRTLFTEARLHCEEEICGLIGVTQAKEFRIYPVENIAEHKQCLFEMHPAQQIAAMKTMREQDETLFAIYHSHPHGPATPSTADLEQAAYPDTLYLIISLDDTHAADMGGFYLRKGRVETVKLAI